MRCRPHQLTPDRISDATRRCSGAAMVLPVKLRWISRHLLHKRCLSPAIAPVLTVTMTQPTTMANTGVRNKAIERYLLTYNVLSSLGWGYALGGTLTHLYREYHKSSEPSPLTRLRQAGRSVYASGMGKFVLALEGMAIQEIIQARKGWVMTSASTVASQVFARLFVLTYIVERSVAVSSPARPVTGFTITRVSRLT